MQDPIRPKDPAEPVALYRAQIVGPVVRRALEHGDLAVALAELATTRSARRALTARARTRSRR
jgi:hypothetical protein